MSRKLKLRNVSCPLVTGVFLAVFGEPLNLTFADMHFWAATLYLSYCIIATFVSSENATSSSCWQIYGGVCVKTGTDGCPFTGAWFSWLHCPVGYHCCVPPNRLTPPIDRHPLGRCGVPHPPPVAMVIGGVPAAPGDWPWMAQIRRLRRQDSGQRPDLVNGEQHCGGALVHPEWVLSAAHCFAWADPGDTFTIHMGHTDSTDPSRQSFNARRILVHEKFFQPLYSNDIAVVKLDRPAGRVQPICLPEPGETFNDAVGCVAGWGATADSGTSDKLMTTQLPTISSSRCKHLYENTSRPVYPENICAGFLAGERDACNGDSGGPLMIRRDGLWLAAGIVSHGEGCGVPGKPGVYTGVANYVDWIRRSITAG